ncbi:multifunctional transcriptional regulator/nicotinamide-nucleotide adenylyltransferase/ribosylnicotinamide kinase NadR, partial [Morganella morganii]|nr:multifunctional transcriptional regulator/nicotinamide-nucleotide adenylyltransferase/ribosylnicotinamide kinase NadR [Morganella morganii]
IHSFDEHSYDLYPHGWEHLSQVVCLFMWANAITPAFIYSGEKADVPLYRESLGLQPLLIYPVRNLMNISGRQIRPAPFRYGDYFPPEVKPFLVRRFAVAG